jgi:tRNA pseudouridine55 synthase
LATGLLLVLVGRATRLSRYLVGLDKRYLTTIRLGVTTTTGDAEGDILAETTPPDVARVVTELVGEIELPVPAASAVKINGTRAYELHRRGVDFETPMRSSTVYEADLLNVSETTATLDLRVSSGTYIRSIAGHLGGHCVSLRRTAVGPFSVEDADEQRVRPASEALPFFPLVELSDEEVSRVAHGGAVASGATEGLVRLVTHGELVAVAQSGQGVAKPETVLAVS